MFHLVISLIFYSACEDFSDMKSYPLIIFLHTHVHRKNLREPSSNQIKSNIYYVRIHERKHQRLSLSLPTVEPHFLLDMDTLTLQTVFLIPGSKQACQLTWTPINADRHIGSII